MPRFVLANTEVLHDKISVLANRVRQLEDALHEAHADRSSEPHPLLTPELLQLKRPLERETSDPVREPEVDATEVIDAVGSLYVRALGFCPHTRRNSRVSSRSISESGQSKFYGTTANAWVCLFHHLWRTHLTLCLVVFTSGTSVTLQDEHTTNR